MAWQRRNTVVGVIGMKGLSLILVLSGLGVDFDLKTNENGQPEYVIRIESVVVDALAKGQPIVSDIPPEAANVRNFRIYVDVPKGGREPLRDSQVSYGWRPTDDGFLEYVVQIHPERLKTLGAGTPIASTIHADATRVRRFVVYAGTGEVARVGLPTPVDSPTALRPPTDVLDPPEKPDANEPAIQPPANRVEPAQFTESVNTPTESVVTRGNDGLPGVRYDTGAYNAPTRRGQNPAVTLTPVGGGTTYSTTPGYSTSPTYVNQPAYSNQPNYTGSTTYGTQPNYTTQPNYGTQPNYTVERDPNYNSGWTSGSNSWQSPNSWSSGNSTWQPGPPYRANNNQTVPYGYASSYGTGGSYNPYADGYSVAKPTDTWTSGTGVNPTNRNLAVNGQPQYLVDPNAPIVRPWTPLILTTIALFASIGGNAYLGWLAWSFFWRYRDVAAEIARLRSAASGSRSRAAA